MLNNQMRAATLNRKAVRGFTLIELLVVIIILAILAAVVVPRVIGRTEDAKQAKVISDLKALDTALDLFKVDVGNYPATDQGIQALMQNPGLPKWNGPYVKSMPSDPWGAPYQYKCPSEHNQEYDIWATSPDGKQFSNWEMQ